jgi:transposase
VIDLETLARIRQLYYGEHWRVGTIAAELGLHHETVEAALREETKAKPAPRPSRFDPFVGFAREMLEKYPRLRSTRLWHMLRERGCTLSVRQVRDKVRELRPAPREAFLVRRTFPAEDYGESPVMVSSPAHLPDRRQGRRDVLVASFP